MDERYCARQKVMADGRHNRSDSRPSSSSNTAKQQKTKSDKWGSSSKFNRIFNHIERSILAQFNGGPSGRSSTSNDHHQNNSSHKPAGQSLTSKAHTKSSATVATKSANKLSSNSSESPSMQTDAAALTSQMDRVTSDLRLNASAGSHEELASSSSQLTPANKNGKMILNKYQQQIISAMQTNKNRPATGKNNDSGTSRSSYSHNRLSIPPPHANDEARNQNHRLLFGYPRTQPTEYLSTSDQMASIYERTTANVNQNTVDPSSAAFYHNSTSPASSAQSLPVTKPGFSQVHAHRTRNSVVEGGESTIDTYQSRELADTQSAHRISNDCNKSDNNMMFMQANQLPLGNHPRFSLNKLTPPHQQQVIHHHSMQPRVSQQRPANNTQQHNSNQVPISQSIMYNSNVHNLHQQHQNIHGPIDYRNQTYGSYGHLGPMHVPQLSMQQQYQPQPQYEGQIYANAPPKPRRYQYYEPNLSMNPNSVASARANYPLIDSTQFISQNARGQPARQISYSIATGQAQTYNDQQRYNNQHSEVVNGPVIPYGPQRQLPMLPQQPTLTKSKSSLDIAEIARLKQTRIQAEGMLRVQAQGSNAPVYGSTRFINQIESSTLQHNQGYSARTKVNYNLQQQPPTNLQRSKSIGNLLPNYNTHEFNMNQRQLAPFSMSNHPQQHQSVALAYPKFLTVSSASTHNLNYSGFSNNGTMLSGNNIQGSKQANQMISQNQRPSVVNNLVQKQHQQQILVSQNAPPLPMRQCHQQPYRGDICWQNQTQNEGIVHNNGDGEMTKANPTTIPNSGKIVRPSLNSGASTNSAPPTEGSGFIRQSLDDKIRNLLIGDDSASIVGPNNSGNKKTESWGVATAWPAQKQSQSQYPKQTQPSQEEADSNSVSICGTTRSFSNSHLERGRENNPENSERLVHEQIYPPEATSASMGNRHQRQYQVDDGSARVQDHQVKIGQRNAGTHCDSVSVNSQLIVDLTTPRVLTKTQTTLLPVTSVADQASRPQQWGQEAWSFNQLGLPTNYTEQFALNTESDAPNCESGSATNEGTIANKTSVPAPYYYSDLKSEEQRLALFNIVQQKSLSPPPQLLSRSIDQSSTRLAPKSATMHAGQARLFSESLASSQRKLQNKIPTQDSKSTNNIPSLSSESSVAKNIDKLFESPIDPKLSKQISNELHSVNSMITLSTEVVDNDSSIMKDQNQIESLSNSSGYCSDAWKKSVSKSRSLENINQKQMESGSDNASSKSTFHENHKGYGNPVYENIRRSDKLLSAINNSTTCLSTSSTRNRKPRSIPPPTRPQPTSGSDSMDSILGSSFDDDEDDSGESPADIDSDSSTTGIDFIKLSPTTADMSELIEQLRNNHAKLTDEYKSTLARISKILNRKDPSGKRRINDKLAARLQRLEYKSKKCESRSKNQLALIQMMEKAFRQTRRNSDAAFTQEYPEKVPDQNASPQTKDDKTNHHNELIDSTQDHSLSSFKQEPLSCISTTPCHSIDYQNLQQKTQPVSDNFPAPPPPPVFEAQNVIKAIVTEATSLEVPKKFTAELCSQSKTAHNPPSRPIDSVSLSTRHQQVKNQDNKDGSKFVLNGTVGQRIQSIESTVKRSDKSPPKGDKLDDSASMSLDDTDTKGKTSRTFREFADDEDDFIEFLSTGSSSTHGRSQFESSQFSASDFNNSSSSSGSTSESSHSGSVTTDSLDISSKSLAPDGPVKSAGILKSPKTDDNLSKKRQNNIRNNNINSDDKNQTFKNNINSNGNDKPKGENKFKNVLGNVIDVDVYPVNMNQSSSPVVDIQ